MVSTPRVHMLSLTASGMPARGPGVPARGESGVGGRGGLLRPLGVQRQVGVQLGLGGRGPAAHRGQEGGGGHLPGAQGGPGGGDGEIGGIAGHASSMNGGTRK